MSNNYNNEDAYNTEISSLKSNVPDIPASPIEGVLDRLVYNARARQCFNNIKIGVKMGITVGGIFGLLAGTVYAVRDRRFLLVPVTTVVCATSFGFFLGCGMIIRCDSRNK